MNGRGHVPADNLRLWREQLSDNRELRLLQIGMLAESLADTLSAGEEFASAPAELLPVSADAFWRAVGTDERLALCHALLKLRPDLSVREDTPLPPPAAPRVARLSGEVFTRAAEAFAPLLPNATPVTLSSLSELLEATASGEADFAKLLEENPNPAIRCQFCNTEHFCKK